MSTATRFRVKKTVSAPAIGGKAGDLESLVSHATNPAAHPDFVRKGELADRFNAAAHISSPVAHAVTNIRRSEVMTTTLDYERTKFKSLVNNAENYSKSNPERYLVSSYVLNLILTNLGLSDTSNFLRTSAVVHATSSVPVKDLENYIPSYALFKLIQDRVTAWMDTETGIEATYLKKTVAGTLYSAISHTHEILSLTGAKNVLGYRLTDDVLAVDGKSYYKYHKETQTMIVDSTIVPDITRVDDGEHYEKFEDILDVLRGEIAALEDFNKTLKFFVCPEEYGSGDPPTKIDGPTLDYWTTDAEDERKERVIETEGIIEPEDLEDYDYEVVVLDGETISVNPLVEVLLVPASTEPEIAAKYVIAPIQSFLTNSLLDGELRLRLPKTWYRSNGTPISADDAKTTELVIRAKRRVDIEPNA